MADPRFQLARRHKFVTRTSADLSLTSTTWANLDTGLDLVLAGAVGHVVEIGMIGQVQNEAVEAYINAGTWNGTAMVTFFGSGEPTTTTGGGVNNWNAAASVVTKLGLGVPKLTLVAGDVVAGLVTVRFRYRVSSGTKTLSASSTLPLQVWAENLGPPDST